MSEKQYTIETDVACVYKLRLEDGYGWADITIRQTSKGGAIDVQSDCGSYAHNWYSTGPRDFRLFLAGLNFDYFMGKTRPGYMRFDRAGTTLSLRELIFELRRERNLTKEDARELYDNVDWYLGECSTADDYYRVFYNHFNHLSDGCDAPYSEKPDAMSVAFWDGPWAAVCKQWRADLAAEKTQLREAA